MGMGRLVGRSLWIFVCSDGVSGEGGREGWMACVEFWCDLGRGRLLVLSCGRLDEDCV